MHLGMYLYLCFVSCMIFLFISLYSTLVWRFYSALQIKLYCIVLDTLFAQVTFSEASLHVKRLLRS